MHKNQNLSTRGKTTKDLPNINFINKLETKTVMNLHTDRNLKRKRMENYNKYTKYLRRDSIDSPK